MQVNTTNADAVQLECDALVVGVFAGEALSGAAAAVDKASSGALTRLKEAGELTGKALELVQILAPAGVKALRVVAVGLGPKKELNRQTAFRAAGAAARSLAGKSRKKIAYYLGSDFDAEQSESAVCGALVGCVGQDLYRANKDLFPPEEIVVSGFDPAAVAAGRALGEGMNLTRRLVNEPASAIYPESFAEVAEKMAGEHGLSVEVWDKDRLTKERCGSLLGVSQGSERPPRLVILRYNGGKSGDAPLALVGKGVTFDSGGLSIKASDGMSTMKCDMAGAATVVGTLQAIAALKLPVNVIGLVGLTENMISGNSYKLGDVLTARNGKTIEVLNTDAEGRLVLADVLCVTVEQKPARIIDLATLTGACMVALGTEVAGLMTNDQAWCDEIAAAADICGEGAWQLPMFAEYGEQIKSNVADIKNVGAGRWGGAITAAKFLEEFVDKTPWTHIDIAGPAFADKPKNWIDGGGSGCMVRTLVEVARRFPKA